MLEVNAIDLHYGAAQALRGISLKAAPGTVTCVLGRNGVGKSSLLRALVGQHPVSKGSITWETNDITTLRPSERARRGIAYVPQGARYSPPAHRRGKLANRVCAAQARRSHRPRRLVFSLFPRAQRHAAPSRRRSLGRPAAATCDRTRPRHAAAPLAARRADRRHQPSIIKDIGRAIAYLRGLGEMAIVLVEQYSICPRTRETAQVGDGAADVLDDRGLDAFGRLVEQQEARPHDEGASDRKLLLLAAREIAAATAQHAAEHGKQREHHLRDGAIVALERRKPGLQVFLDGEQREYLAP